jgi:hypothetical protein
VYARVYERLRLYCVSQKKKIADGLVSLFCLGSTSITAVEDICDHLCTFVSCFEYAFVWDRKYTV